MRMVRWVLGWLGRIFVVGVVLSLAAVLVTRVVDPPLTPLMVIRAVEGRLAGTPVGITHRWVPLADVSPALLRAVIAAEDARFLEHHGVDVRALEEARAFNERQRGTRRRGGSTITMQCARNVFLWPARTYVRKALEIWFAGLLELVWGKRRILEVYLNVVEWGPGVYGAEAAAEHWFGVPAARLDARQAALLAVTLPSPRRWNPSAPSGFLRARAATVARRAAAVRLGSLVSGAALRDPG